MSKRPFDLTAHRDAMLRYARALTRGDAAAADDLVSDALLKAVEGGGGFRSGGNLRGWLLSILHNTFVSARRRAAAEARRDEAAMHVADTVAAPAQDASVRLAQVRQAFFGLPEEQREALHLVAVEGLTYEEAARILEIPVGTLMSRLSRARDALRRWEDGREPRPSLRIVGGKDAS